MITDVRKIYFQKVDGEFFINTVLDAWQIFKWLGYETAFFEKEELPNLNLNKDTLVVGSVEAVLESLDLLQIERPLPIDYPSELTEFLQRNVFKSTMGWVRKQVQQGIPQPKFIKSVAHKGFSPFVANKRDSLLFHYDVKDEIPVWVSDEIDFDTEYRCFVLHNKLVGMKHYTGDFKVFPDINEIELMIRKYTMAPTAYSLDVGVLNDKTALVEVNDAFALGNYGWYSQKYTDMLEYRWLELINKK